MSDGIRKTSRLTHFFAKRTRLTLWLASLIIVANILGLFAIELQSRYAAELAEADRESQGVADVLAEHAAQAFESVDLALQLAITIRNDVSEGRTTAQKAGEFLQNLKQGLPALIAIGWTNEKGEILAHSYKGPIVQHDIADLIHFIVHRDSPQAGFFISPLYRSKATKGWISSVSRRLNYDDGSFAGVVTAPLDISYFARIFQSVRVGSNGTVTLMQRDGTVLMREPFREDAVGKSFANSDLFSRMVGAGRFGTFESQSPVDGVRRLVAFRTVADLPLIMVVTRDRAEVLAPWYNHLELFGPLVALLVMVVLLGTAVLSSRTQQLARKASLLEATLENMDQGLIVVDESDRIAIYNRRALQLLDLPETFVVGCPSSSEVVGYQTARGEFANVPEAIKSLIQSGATDDAEAVYERERPNGTTLEIRAVPFSNGGVVRTFKDVTGWKHIERELGERERQFRLLAENATDIIARLDFEGRLLYISPSCHSLMGYSAEEMLGTKVTKYMVQDDIAPTMKYFCQLRDGAPRDQSRVEYRAIHKNGHAIWLEASPRLVVDEAGKPLEFVDVVREITERKAIELEAAAAKEQAEEAAAAQAQFLATMSHELRTPLNGIVGFADVILSRTDLAPDVRRQIGLIQTASDVLLTIVNDVLDFSRIEEGKLELTMVEFDLFRLIETSFKIVFASAVAKDLDVRISVDDQIAPRLVGDEHRLRQILLNLLNNAIKFTKEGAVSLTVELTAQDETAQELRFSVTDTGIGIAEDKLGQLFQRFSQVDGSTSREYGGSGLGLAISKRLVEMMGGEIGVESTPGKGSTFWIRLSLPRATGLAVLPGHAVVPASPASASLLLVEDVEFNREIACSILRNMGYRVDAVSSGFEAISAVQSGRYDLVLMDIQMPGMDGLAATRKIRALPGEVATIPIVAMTANVLPKQIESFRSAGMNDHIGKPFKRDELGATIERCLSGAELAPWPAVADAADHAMDDDAALAPLAALLGRVKADDMLREFKVELQRFVGADAASPDLALQAHRLISQAGMLGFRNLSKHFSDLEETLSGGAPSTITVDEVRQACMAALAEIAARFEHDKAALAAASAR